MTIQEQTDQRHQALLTFERELPQLMKEHSRQWVAYLGDQRLGFAGQKHELYQQCFQRGLQRDEFVVFCVEPQETEMILGPVVLD